MIEESEQINVTVVTAYQHARGGDLISACLYMRAMLKQDKNIKITWVVKRDIEGYAADIKKYLDAIETDGNIARVELVCIDSADYEKISILSRNISDFSEQELYAMSERNWSTSTRDGSGGWLELQKKFNKESEFAEKIKKTHLFVSVPNAHRFVDRDRLFFTNLGIPFIAISEYDCVSHVNNLLPERKYVNCRKLPSFYVRKYNTGFSEYALGVYVDEVMLSTDKAEDIVKEDVVLKEYLLEKQDSLLFYGYFFVKDSVDLEAKNSWVSVKNYIKLCINNAQQNIDIVLPINNTGALTKALKEIILELSENDKQKIKELKLSKLDGNNFKEEILMTSQNGFNIRIINPLKIHRKTVQCLLNQSDLLCGLTGDQSFIEGLVKGKLVCYQIMKWKVKFFEAFLKFVEAKFGTNSLIYQFYSKQITDSIDQKEVPLSDFFKFYNTADKPLLKKQAEALAVFIKEEKNLLKEDIFCEFVEKAKQAKQQLLSNRQEFKKAIVVKKDSSKVLCKAAEQEGYDNVYHEYSALQLIKTVRFDGKDFNGEFIFGMTELLTEEKGVKLENIRKSLRTTSKYAQFKFKPSGVITIGSKQCFTLEEKRGFSKKQSFSAVSKKQGLYTNVFGFSTRGDDLTGVILFSNCLDKGQEQDEHFLPADYINSRDAGTVNKPFYFSDYNYATQYYYEQTVTRKVMYASIKDLIEDCVKRNHSAYNEILLRAKWIPGDSRCHLGVFSQNLTAKIIVQLRALDWKIHTGEDFIPITFYLPKENDKKFSPYLLEKQQEDLQDGLESNDPIVEAMSLIINSYNTNKKLDFSSLNEDVQEQVCMLLFSEKRITHSSKLVLLEKIFNVSFSSLSEENKLNYMNDYNKYYYVIFDKLPKELIESKAFCKFFKLNTEKFSKDLLLLYNMPESLVEYCVREKLLVIEELNISVTNFVDILIEMPEQFRLNFIRRCIKFLHEKTFSIYDVYGILGCFQESTRFEVLKLLVEKFSSKFFNVYFVKYILKKIQDDSNKIKDFKLILSEIEKSEDIFYKDTILVDILNCFQESTRFEVLKLLVEKFSISKEFFNARDIKDVLKKMHNDSDIHKIDALKLMLKDIEDSCCKNTTWVVNILGCFKELTRFEVLKLLFEKFSISKEFFIVSDIKDILEKIQNDSDSNKIKALELILSKIEESKNSLYKDTLLNILGCFQESTTRLEALKLLVETYSKKLVVVVETTDALYEIIAKISNNDNNKNIVHDLLKERCYIKQPEKLDGLTQWGLVNRILSPPRPKM